MLIANSLNICSSRFKQTEMIGRMAAAGYEALDFNVGDLMDLLDFSDPAAADPWLDELASAAEAGGLEWVQAHGPWILTVGPERLGDSIRWAIRACGHLGVPWMVVHPLLHPDQPAAMNAQGRQRSIDENAAFFRSVLDECEKSHVGIAIENMPDTIRQEGKGRQISDYTDAKMLCELIDVLDHPLVGACWDTGHAHISGLDQPHELLLLGRRLKAVHVQDNDGRSDQHVLPFTVGPGRIDWPAVMEGLAQAEYSGAFTFEVQMSFCGVPDELFDQTLRYSVEIARHLLRRRDAGQPPSRLDAAKPTQDS